MTYNALIEAIRQHINGIDCEGCPYENAEECPTTEEFALLAADAIEALQRGESNGTNAI